MAFGVSTLAMLIQLSHSHKKNKILISIDPFQRTQWEGMGLQLISGTGLGYMHKLVEEKSGFDTVNSVKSRLGNYFVKKENAARVCKNNFLLRH